MAALATRHNNRSINTTSKLGLPTHIFLKINTARFEKTGKRPEAPQQATHRDNKGAHGDLANRGGCGSLRARSQGPKDLELLIWELALRFEPHHRAESCKLVIPLARLETFE